MRTLWLAAVVINIAVSPQSISQHWAESANPDNDKASSTGDASVDSIDTALRRLCAKPEVNLPFLSVYSFRHRVTSVLRASKEPRVPANRFLTSSATAGPATAPREATGDMSPEYLAEAALALGRVDGGCSSSLNQFPRNSHSRLPPGKGKLAKSLEVMVGATGIEPVTPTMSR